MTLLINLGLKSRGYYMAIQELDGPSADIVYSFLYVKLRRYCYYEGAKIL